MASAPLAMLCFDSVFSLLARLLSWNWYCLEMTVTIGIYHSKDKYISVFRTFETNYKI